MSWTARKDNTGLYPREWMYKRQEGGRERKKESWRGEADDDSRSLESRLIRGERFAGNIDAEAGILRKLTIMGELLLSEGGKIVDADGSVWDQAGITLVATTASLGDVISGTRTGFTSQNWGLGAGIDTNLVNLALRSHWNDGLSVRETMLSLVSANTAAGTYARIWTPNDPAGPNNPSLTIYQNGQLAAEAFFGFPPFDSNISGGSTNLRPSAWIRLDTEGSAATDDLDTIQADTGFTLMAGQLLIVTAVNSSRTIVAKDGTGNLKLAGDCSLDNAEDTLLLMYDGSSWLEVSRSNNGA